MSNFDILPDDLNLGIVTELSGKRIEVTQTKSMWGWQYFNGQGKKSKPKHHKDYQVTVDEAFETFPDVDTFAPAHDANPDGSEGRWVRIEADTVIGVEPEDEPIDLPIPTEAPKVNKSRLKQSAEMKPDEAALALRGQKNAGDREINPAQEMLDFQDKVIANFEKYQEEVEERKRRAKGRRVFGFGKNRRR